MRKTGRTKLAGLIILTVLFTMDCISLHAQDKKKRVYRPKEETDGTILEKYALQTIDSVIVKFSEGTRIRLRGRTFRSFENMVGDKERSLLKDNQIDLQVIKKELTALNNLLRTSRGIAVKRYFVRSEAAIDQEQDTLESKVNEELADLNLYYLVTVKNGKAASLIDPLNSFKIVENAYPVYKVENAVFKSKNEYPGKRSTAPGTDDLSGRQIYLNAAPDGINAKYAWTVPGGNAEGITIIDVEYLWDITHEDIKAPFWISNPDVDSHGSEDGDHGTAVLGEIVANHNAFGIKGICPAAIYGISGVRWRQGTHVAMVGAAIDYAAAQLQKGDIILIEQHTPGPSVRGARSTCNPEQFEYVPMEFYQECFDAIRRATAKGVIVVEAAGNGEVNLDAAVYGKLFDRKVRDSKAIMVAGDEGGNGHAACWTNYGSRIDFFGWGGNIVTTGYGDLPGMPADPHKKYTSVFGGTSGASPIIVGAIACIQGIRKKYGLETWSAELIRQNITGTAQVPGNKFIGRMPDLKATIESMKLVIPDK